MSKSKPTIFGVGALEVLTEYVKQTKSTANSAAEDVKSMRKDLVSLAECVNAVLQEIGGAILTLDSEKAYIAGRKEFTLSASGWTEDMDSDLIDYVYKYTLTLPGITADTKVDAVLDVNSASSAGECEMCPVCETAANAVIFRSRTAPGEDLAGILYITQGEAEKSDAEEETTEKGA